MADGAPEPAFAPGEAREQSKHRRIGTGPLPPACRSHSEQVRAACLQKAEHHYACRRCGVCRDIPNEWEKTRTVKVWEMWCNNYMQRLEKHELHCGPAGVQLSLANFQASSDRGACRFVFLTQCIQGSLAREDCVVGECHMRSVAEVARPGTLSFLSFSAF